MADAAPALDPLALAQTDDDDDRSGVQPVTEYMIFKHVFGDGELHNETSARAFAAWLHTNWFDWTDDSEGNLTNGKVINGALADWRGNV